MRTSTSRALWVGALGATASACAPRGDAEWKSVLALAAAAAAGVGLGMMLRSSRRLKRELEKRARELEISEERHRLLLAQASDAIFVTDADTGAILEANRYGCELLGWTEKELIGRNHTTLHPKDERDRVRCAFAAHAKSGGIVEADTTVLHRAGEAIPVNVRASLITAGARRYMQAIMRDLRPRVRAEEAVRRSESHLRELVERAPVAVIEQDFTLVGAWLEELRGRGVRDLGDFLAANPSALAEQFARVRVLAANPAALRTTGVPDLATYVAKMPSTVTAEVLQAFSQELLALWSGRPEVVSEIVFRRLDGSSGHGVLHWRVATTNGKLDLARVLVVVSDLTQLRATEAKLREVEDRWELAVRGLNVGIFEQNYITGETFLSDRWKEMLGYAPGELATRRDEWQGRVHPDDRAHVLEAMHAHLRRENDFYQVEYRIRCRDGGYKWILARGRAVFGPDGTALRLIGAHADIGERKAAEAAMQASEVRYRELFDRSPVAILEEDFSEVHRWLGEQGVRTPGELHAWLRRDGGALRSCYQRVRLRAANRAALAYLGAASFEELAPRKYANPPDGVLRAFQCELEALLAARDETTVDVEYVDASGRMRYQTLRWSVARRPDGALELSRILVALIDITELKNAEEAIRRGEQRWQLAIQGTQDGIWEYDFRTKRSFYSDRWKEMLGCRPDEIGDGADEWLGRIHPEDLALVNAASEAHNRGETPYFQVEFRMRSKDGGYKWILSRGQAQFDGQGVPFRSVGSHTDITARKLSEAALRDSERRYRRLFEDNPCPMWVYDRETLQFLAVNATTVRYYGYSAEEFAGMTILDIRPPEEIPRLREALARWQSGEELPGLWRHRCKDGRQMFMRVRSHAHEFAGRSAVLVLGEDVTERHEAEERLRDSETRYRALFESAVEGVYVTDAEDTFRSANPALAGLLGYDDPKHLLSAIQSPGRDFYVQPGRRRQFFEALGAQDTLTDFESEVRCADGALRWISENVRALRDGDGRIAQLQGFVSDITGRKLAEEAIRASEARYRGLFEQSPVAIVEEDFRGVAAWLEGLRAAGVADLGAYLDANPRELAQAIEKVVVVGMNRETVRLARATSKQELIENLARVFTPDAFVARREAFLAMWDGRSEIEGELTLHALDGSPRRLFFRWWVPRIDGRDNLALTQVVLIDLTDIRTTEAELAAERQRLRVTLRAMAEGLLTTDTAGVVHFMNGAAERLTGWTAGAAIGRKIEEICSLRHEKTRSLVPMPVAKAIEEHRVVEFPLQTTLVSRDNTSYLVDGRCAPMHDLTGKAIGAVVVFRDVTERARLEAELLRSSKLESVGILAGGIAHDFNNLLTVVMGNVTLAMLDSQVMAAAGRWLEEAERGVMRARDLTQQLLTFAKGGEPIRKAVRLPEVVRDAAEFALHGAKVRCEFTIAEDLWAADVDKGQIGQVVQNLVINAVQAMPEGGVIRVKLTNERPTETLPPSLASGKYLRFDISDSGSGIRAEHLARIFDPYFTTKQSGSGLGLATVYSIVRKHQGHIEVESELGKGTTFHVWLPAAPDAKPVRAEDQDTLTRMSGKVLFMDDEDTIRAVAKMLLARLGFEVTTTADGESAVAAYQTAMDRGNPFSFVIMDLTVPGGMGGQDAMKELLKIDPDVKAIVSSGYSHDPVLSNYRAHGFCGMVPKPYKLTDLARTIRSVLEEKTVG